MISISKVFQLTGQAPFQYAFSSNSSNVTFSSSAGTLTSSRLEVTVFFASEADIDNAQATLQVTSACGNSDNHEFTFTNVCDQLTLSNITQTVDGDELIFRVNVGGSTCSSLSYQWTYEDLELISSIDTLQYSQIRVRRTALTNLSQNITVAVSDSCSGCVRSKSLVLTTCQPNATDLVYNFNRSKTGSFSAVSKVVPTPSGCGDFVVDWSTLQVDLPTGFTFTANENTLTIIPPTSSIGGSFYGTYVVYGTSGVPSGTGQILINVQDATGAGDRIYIPNQVIHLDCGASENDVVAIPIENIVVQDGVVIDWDTFEVLTSPTPLGSINPTIQFAVNFLFDGSANPFIEYTVPANFSQDSFAWIVADTDGVYMRSTVFTVSECIPSPTAVDDAFTVVCGTTTSLDVTANDSANGGNPINQVVVTTAPNVGSYSVSGTTVNYTAPAAYSGTVTINYKAVSGTGEESAEATVTITIICAGQTRTLTHCE